MRASGRITSSSTTTEPTKADIMRPGNSRKSFHRRFARASDHCANNGRSGRNSLAREFSGMQFDEVVHAERLLARELKQILGHTVIAALLCSAPSSRRGA